MDSSITETRHENLLLVQTTDFFYPLVESPYEQGMIAAANVLSDMYACGVSECDNMLMILGVSLGMSQEDQDIVTKEMIKGFRDQAAIAGTKVTGGQTVLNPWPIIGGVATAIEHKDKVVDPQFAKAGDVIVLTKALGTQLAVNLKEWMRTDAAWTRRVPSDEIITREVAQAAYDKARKSMSRLNRVGAGLMIKHGAHAATDVTGFGILGHAQNLASHQAAELDVILHKLPIIAGMLAVDAHMPNVFKLKEGYSAETSGGLMVALPADVADAFIADIEAMEGCPAWIIGKVVAGSKNARLADDVEYLEV